MSVNAVESWATGPSGNTALSDVWHIELEARKTQVLFLGQAKIDADFALTVLF